MPGLKGEISIKHSSFKYLIYKYFINPKDFSSFYSKFYDNIRSFFCNEAFKYTDSVFYAH